MARETSHSKLPSNARRRRQLHLARAADLHRRKRVRAQRAEIHAAMEAAARLVAVSSRGPYKAGEKTSDGWALLDRDGVIIGTFPSREKLRKAVAERNERGPITRDEAMELLGWRRMLGDVEANEQNGWSKSTTITSRGSIGGHPVENKFVRVEA